LQYSFIQILLLYQQTIHMYSSADRLHRIYVNEQKRYIIALRFQTVLFMPQFTKKMPTYLPIHYNVINPL